jgi:hypothetical protein
MGVVAALDVAGDRRMSPAKRAAEKVMPSEYLRIPARRILVESPIVHLSFGPGDRVLVTPGQKIDAGKIIAERTADPQLVDVGRLGGSNGSGRVAGRDQAQERRRPPAPGKWWIGGDDRRGKASRREGARRVAGTLLYEFGEHWMAAVGERHEQVESPVSGVVTQASSCVGVTVVAHGVAIPGAVAGGQPARGYLDVPKLVDGELRDATLDMGRGGAIVVAGGRVSTEALTRARAMSIRGMVAGSLGQGELRDLAASEARQRAGLHLMPAFGVLGLDGHQRRPLASPILTMLAGLAGGEVAIITEPPLLVIDVVSLRKPEVAPDWVRVRSGPHAGREGRWLSSAGLHRFRAGIHLEAANLRLGDDLSPTIVALADLERFIL